MAEWIAHFGWWTDLPWLPFTVLGPNGPDHQWLWHVTLVPYTWFGDSEEVLAWAAASNGALVPATLAFVARMLRVPAAPVFVILAVTAGALMPFRLLMLRSQNIAIIYLALALWTMARGHYRALLAVAFLFMQSYHAAVILAPIALLGCAVHSFLQRRLVIAPAVAVAGGLCLALLVSPWYPRNIEFLMFHTLYKTALPLVGEQLSGLIGSEWYPAPMRVLLLDSWPAHLLLLAATVSVGARWRRETAWRPSAETLIAIGVAVISLGLYLKAIRFAEYYVPFSALAAGLAARDAWAGVRLSRTRLAAFAAAALVLASVGVAGLGRSPPLPRDYMQSIGARLNQLGKPGDIVFNSSWNDFAALAWWSDSFRYINGLDGHFLAYGDPARFVAWLAASLDYVADPAKIIAAGFGARFVVVAKEHAALARKLQASPMAVLCLTTRDGWLFELKR